MSEVMREPFIGTGPDGKEVVIFDEDHTLADICRWIMKNRSDAEDVYAMLGWMLDGTFDMVVQ